MFICILLMVIISKHILLNVKVNQNVYILFPALREQNLLYVTVKQNNREYYTFYLCVGITKSYFVITKVRYDALCKYSHKLA